MPVKSLLALPLVGALVVFTAGTAVANPWPPRVPVYRPVCPPPPACPPGFSAVPPPPSVAPGQLPPLELPPNRQTLTIYNGPCVEQHNFVQSNGSWRSSGAFTDYDVFFRDSPQVPWRYYGTYYSARSAQDAAGILTANGNLADVRPHCA
jgi:hypothetical protein